MALLTIGPFTGGSFNPVRSLAPATLAGTGTDLWLFLEAPLIGGALGGLAFLGRRRLSGGS